jgi:parallel beta-helix repeat protein
MLKPLSLCSLLLVSCTLAPAKMRENPTPPSTALAALDLTDLPVLILEHDDTVIDRSTLVVIPEGLVIEDKNGDGVLHIASDKIAVVFAQGSVLRGASPETPLDQLHGTGIRLDGHKYVLFQGLDIRGFHVGLHATDAEWMKLTGSNFEQLSAMRLSSTIEAEDNTDWLWPHDNDKGEWIQNYGAGVAIENSSHVGVEDVTVRHSQNGIILSEVNDSEVLDCDASYLSGWGLAMWRSSDNLVLANNFDYCVRGYSHGVYNRGQDSAGILAFEQCSRNRFIGNSATHCGDGFFGFAGKEALGERTGVSHDFDWYEKRGNNNNVFEGNDFSYAAAHGLELTFSFGNIIRRNVFRGNAICGIWGGYSQATTIEDNLFVKNGSLGYGVERGGINIDHARNIRIAGNRFGENACGVHLWSLESGFAESPWGLANGLSATGNTLEDNTFYGDEVAVHLRGEVQLAASLNNYLEVGEELRLEGAANLSDSDVREPSSGLQTIRMTEWGPWDGNTAIAMLEAVDSRGDIWRVLGSEERPEVALPGRVDYRVRWFGTAEDGTPLPVGVHRFRVESRNPDSSVKGLLSYNFSLTDAKGGTPLLIKGVLSDFFWSLRQFQNPCDPREDLEQWRAGSERAPTTLHLGKLSLDYFGTFAEAAIQIPAGTWRMTTTSDDGIRVRVWNLDEHLDTSLEAPPSPWPQTWIEDWTHHSPTTITKTFTVAKPSTWQFMVEHFELSGFAVLEVDFERLD